MCILLHNLALKLGAFDLKHFLTGNVETVCHYHCERRVSGL